MSGEIRNSHIDSVLHVFIELYEESQNKGTKSR
jgi:hypothetical protein